MSVHQILKQKSLVIVFAYSPTGLGHLRVTDALYHGLPEDVSAILLGSQDKTISAQYRFITIHPLLRRIFVSMQNGWLGDMTTFFYRTYLHLHNHLLYEQLVTILDERLDLPQTLLIIATHSGLAHQLAAIKSRLAKERKIKVILVVQVTDDSPQSVWYTPGADITFVPSYWTGKVLAAYGRHNHLESTEFITKPYPVSPQLTTPMTERMYDLRRKQYDIGYTGVIHVAIPVSGAAIGTLFFTKLIDYLHGCSGRYLFHVVSKQVFYTRTFLTEMLNRPYVHLHVSPHDRGTVAYYEELYKKTAIGLEITKPSEQAFKALAKPYHNGGSILLLAEPVGKQEQDNIAFLRRHHLIPSLPFHNTLWTWAEENKILTDEERHTLFEQAHHWRGLQLPLHSLQSSKFIHWCLQVGVFEAMFHHKHTEKIDTAEVASNGVQQFWETIAQKLQKLT